MFTKEDGTTINNEGLKSSRKNQYFLKIAARPF